MAEGRDRDRPEDELSGRAADGEARAARVSEEPRPQLGLRDVGAIFLRAGMAFGGGLGILAVLEDELVRRRRVVTREEFLTTYALGRVVPSGTMTALAVAFGRRFGGFLGTLVALAALILPAFVLTVALTAAYTYVSAADLLPVLAVTLLPAALALIVAAAVRMARPLVGAPLELALAAAAFVAIAVLGLDPTFLLLGGGLLGAAVLRPPRPDSR